MHAYRTRDFSAWENLGVLLSTDARAKGTLFVPRVVYNKASSKYVMWFENYNASATPFKPNATQPKGEYSIAVSDSADRGFVVVKDRENGSASFACGGSQGDFDVFLDEASGKAYIVNTYYTSMCIEELDSTFTGGTNKTASSRNPLGNQESTRTSRCGDRLPSAFVDVRSSDDVIAF